MVRARNPIPSYLHHRQSGKARVVVYDESGQRRQIMLPGKFNSKESIEEYHRICDTLRSNHGRLPLKNSTGTVDLTISEFVLRYMNDHAAAYYVDPVTKAPTSEIDCLRQAFRPLNRLFGKLTTAEFDSLKLEILQTAIATGSWLNKKERKAKEKQKRPVDVSRGTVNRHVDRIKRLFRWACAKKIVPADNLVNLLAVASLKAGRSVARETLHVAPVEIESIDAILPFLPPVPADIVRLLLLTGARIGELCQLCSRDLDRSGPVWLFQVYRHKTRHRGHDRTVAFGPQAQLILRRYLKADPDAVLFSPAEQDAFLKAKKRAYSRASRIEPRRSRSGSQGTATRRTRSITPFAELASRPAFRSGTRTSCGTAPRCSSCVSTASRQREAFLGIER